MTGSPVIQTGTGAEITIDGTAGGSGIGIFAGCQFTTLSGDTKWSPYWPDSQALATGTTAEAFVWDDPQILFRAQSSGTTTAADIGAVIDSVATSQGSTVTGISGWELAASTGGDQFKIIGLYNHPNNAHGANAQLTVVYREHDLLATTASRVAV
jgi:hypothetical protein